MATNDPFFYKDSGNVLRVGGCNRDMEWIRWGRYYLENLMVIGALDLKIGGGC